MFDISWGDPASETVAQHRERKGREDQRISRNAKRTSFRSSSSSSTSSKNRGAPRSALFSLFGGSKRPFTENTKPIIRLERPYSPSPPSSNTSPVTELEGRKIPGILDQPTPYPSRYRDSITETVLSSPTSRADSVFSGWLSRSNGTESSWSSTTDEPTKTHEIQSLSLDSFVTRSTEITISSLDSAAQVIRPISKVHISAQNFDSGGIVPDTEPDLYSFPKVPNYTSSLLHGQSLTNMTTRDAHTEVSDKRRDTWKPPDDWECPSDEHDIANQFPVQTPNRLASRVQSSRSSRSTTPRLTQMQRHIKRMEAATPKIMLERLKEEWTDIADASVYKELEFEKQLWMLTGLAYLKYRASGTRTCSYEIPSPAALPSGGTKVLSLYENQACASFLATFSPATEIHHLTTSTGIPTVHKIHPITVPTPHAILPYAPSIFSSIHGLTLPSILSAPSIPVILRECHRVLRSDGTLHLTILDPAPISSTIGPKLRTWLDNHLLLTLETQFRCSNPSRLLPIWLYNAGFSSQGEHTSISMLNFWAIGRGEGGFDLEEDDGESFATKEDGQFKAVLGRMLWREIWGNFVVGDRWWWEDEKIVEECSRLGTRWECAILEVVKRN